MKDQYVGDINDYAKYQLLRLARLKFNLLVVAWMLTRGDRRGDGGRIRYLSQPHLRDEDPELFDALAPLVAGDRCVAALERTGILEGCVFASEPIDRGHEERAAYFANLRKHAGPDTLFFFDPDNGLEVPSVPRHRSDAARYLFWNELAPFRDAGASALIYQHFPRVARKPYLDRLLARLSGEMGDGYSVFAAHTSQVAFLYALRQQKADGLRAEIERRCARSRLISLHAAD